MQTANSQKLAALSITLVMNFLIIASVAHLFDGKLHEAPLQARTLAANTAVFGEILSAT